jgi:hypothetical protein
MQAACQRQNWGSAAEVILGPAPQLALYGEVVVWFHKVELFRRQEEQRMYRQSPAPEDLALHKELLLRLMTDGEHLTRLIEQHGLLANVEGVSAEDLKATVLNLQADYRGWHQPMPDFQRAQILHDVFDVPKPAH